MVGGTGIDDELDGIEGRSGLASTEVIMEGTRYVFCEAVEQNGLSGHIIARHYVCYTTVRGGWRWNPSWGAYQVRVERDPVRGVVNNGVKWVVRRRLTTPMYCLRIVGSGGA
jgi:hypothetical protein